MEKTLHFVIHPRPPGPMAHRIATVEDVVIRVLETSHPGVRFDASFEQVAERLQQLPRMFLEPDGSFVWINQTASPPCQVDGNLTDDGERLLALEIKSCCDQKTLDQLLGSVGWPTQQVLFQLVRQGVYLEEAEFRLHFV